MGFGKTCIDLCDKLNIREWTWCTKDNKLYFEFNLDEFDELINLGIVTNGENGGLVLGNLHFEGGIHLLEPISDER